MDILKYAAQKNINDICTCMCTTTATSTVQFTSSRDSACAAYLADSSLWASYYDRYSCYERCGKYAIDIVPWCTTYWASIPTMPGGSTSTAGTNPATGTEYSGFKVCAAPAHNV